MSSISEWSYQDLLGNFGTNGCSVKACGFHFEPSCDGLANCCALNLSDAIIRSGYTLPSASNVNFCGHAVNQTNGQQRVRNADGLARICRKQNGGTIDTSTWAKRPSWKGIVFFEGGPSLSGPGITGHIDLWDGSKGVHATYSDADVVWFFKLG